MKTYHSLLFDLDGTLTNSMLGIANCIKYALRTLGVECDQLDCTPYIGPPLLDSMRELLCDEDKAYEGLRLYRERYDQLGFLENEVYEGIPQMLKEAKQAGYQIYLATSKPEVFSVRILEHFDLLPYFDCACGATLDGTRSEKTDVIRYVLSSQQVDPSSALMIGDRKYDLLGARECGLDAVGVLYGFGDREELEACKPLAIATTPKELLSYLLSVKG